MLDAELAMVQVKMSAASVKRHLQENLKRVEQRIQDACARAGRQRSDITLIAVTKNVSLDVIRVLVDLDIAQLGENQVVELTKRASMINEWLGRRQRDLSAGAKPRPHWHMVGHLQRNKVKQMLPWIELIHSVDSLRLGEEIDAQSAKLNRVTPVLLQINAAQEAQKYGVAVAAASHLIEQLRTLENLEVRGLMAMAPLTENQTAIRRTFERTKELFDEIVHLRICGAEFKELSLGMTQDFELGIESGATFIRVGSALFEGIELISEPIASN